MIFYSWTALSDSEPAALSDSEPAALSDSEPAALSDSEPAALSEDSRNPRGISDRGPAGEPVAMGITDDRGRAMRAGEDTLGSGLAATVIIEVVRPAMAARTLAPCYVRTGVGWLGRCTEAGEVAWNRFFLRADPDDQQAAGRMGP